PVVLGGRAHRYRRRRNHPGDVLKSILHTLSNGLRTAPSSSRANSTQTCSLRAKLVSPACNPTSPNISAEYKPQTGQEGKGHIATTAPHDTSTTSARIHDTKGASTEPSQLHHP
ncbi:unnamed protein product, partial [Ectocarpus sp. 12 AP-2014]